MIGLIVTTGAAQITGVTLTSPVLIVPTSLSLIPTVGSRIQCTGDHSFGSGDYVDLEHGILVAPLKQPINSCRRMQR